MLNKFVAVAGLALVASTAHAGAALTDMETRWLKAASPVLAYAQRIKLPIDIIVQPTTRANDVPLAMGFKDGRCKLVLTMRGNPDAESILAQVPQAQRKVMMEAMVAHEVGHCWRYAQGAWHALPSGFVESGEPLADEPSLITDAKAMRDNRREEGFADLVALAWTRRHHPGSYGAVYSWLSSLRDAVAVPGSGHDTRAWVRLADNPAVFADSATPFQDVTEAWRRGLQQPH